MAKVRWSVGMDGAGALRRAGASAPWVVLAGVAALTAGCADMGGSPTTGGRAAGRCVDARFPVYFAAGSAELQPDSREVVRTAANRVSGCRIAVDVSGVAAPDAAGRVADASLTQRRAEAVAQALAAAGLPAPTFDVQVAGTATSPTSARTPLARRTEVVLHARPAS